MPCPLCDGSCAAAPLDGLVTDDLAWLWSQLADAADRNGDPALTAGTTTVQAPDGVAGRAAAAGLLARRHLAAGQRLRVDLAALADQLAPLTPGAVVAHATRRRLARRAAHRAARARSEGELRDRLDTLMPDAATDAAWAALRRAGWVTKILNSDDPALLDAAAAVVAVLPAAGKPAVDRRRLAHDATGDPHALDRNRPAAGLALALLTATGRAAPAGTPRDTWASVGVVYDDITGGITTVGIVPDGWTVPAGSPVTLPPRVLADCAWPAGSASVYVTENPSVLSAAADLAGARVICTSGTPSRLEVAALGRLAAAGWRMHVRADFDDAGLNHMNAILEAAPTATTWRMNAADYLRGLDTGESTIALRIDRLTRTPWDPELSATMAAKGIAVYEESFLDDLVADIGGG
jgi:uncharacterized protein (TIGR02679 family)